VVIQHSAPIFTESDHSYQTSYHVPYPMSSSKMSPPHILIIGAGMGGLALAHGLKKHNISFHVYERDAIRDYRAQGYRIRIGGGGIIEGLE